MPAAAQVATAPYPFRDHRSCDQQGLTPRAVELLEYLRRCEVTPSYKEMAKALGCKSKHQIWQLVCQLERRRAITVERSMDGNALPRSLRVVSKAVNLGSVSTRDLVAELERRGASAPTSKMRPHPAPIAEGTQRDHV